MLCPHYAQWLENRHVNAGWWWSAAALVGVLSALVFDQAYDFLFFSWWEYEEAVDESIASCWEIKQAKVTNLNSPCCQMPSRKLSSNLALFASKKDGHRSTTQQTTASLCTIALQVPKFLFSSWTSSYLCVSFLQPMSITWVQHRCNSHV